MSRRWVRVILWFVFWELLFWASVVEQNDTTSTSFGDGPFGLLSFDPASRVMFAPVIWYGHLGFIYVATTVWAALAAAAITFTEDRLWPKARGRVSAWFLGGTCLLLLGEWWASRFEAVQGVLWVFSSTAFLPAVLLAYLSLFVGLALVVLRLHPGREVLSRDG